MVLLAGSLYPILRHQPWKFAGQRQTLRNIAGRHPRLRLVNMAAMDPEETTATLRRWNTGKSEGTRWGLRFEIHVDPDDVRSLTTFRRELKDHPMLTKTFGSVLTNIDCGWWVAGEEPDRIKCDFLLLTP
jgi:hypothetical protein